MATLNDETLNDRAERLMLDAIMAGRVSVGQFKDRRLFRYMVIRNWISPVAPHVILPAGRKLMAVSTLSYPQDPTEKRTDVQNQDKPQ